MAKTRWLLAVAVLFLAGASVTGCAPETKHKLLSTFFDGVPEPGKEPPKKEVRPRLTRAAYQKVVEKKKKEQEQVAAKVVKPEAEKFRLYSEAAEVLPKSYAGVIDWVKALKEDRIKPKAGLDPQAQDQPVLPLDFELTSSANPMFTALFPHSSHTLWLACTNCHTSIFQMKRGTAQVNMTAINEGKYCGRCHGPNPVAFSATTSCPRCHTKLAKEEPMPQARAPAAPVPLERLSTWEQVIKELPKDATGGVDWAKALSEVKIAPRPSLSAGAPDQPPLDLDLDLVPPTNPAFKAVFSHGAHTQWLTCTNCHPSIFQMKKGAARMDMAQIMAGQYCGRCHGKVAFQVQTGCARCHPVMRGG